jgi:glycosyltransferase involved in cell wall biosynthesis
VCGGETEVTLPLAAAAMGIPAVGFSTSGMTELLGRHGILCHGNPNPSAAGDVLRKIAAESRSPALYDADQRRRHLDVGGCVDTVLQILADVRLMEPDETRSG